MSESLSVPKMKLVSPEKRRIYYENILSENPPKNNNTYNKSKVIKINKEKTINSNIENIQTTEAICNIIDLINDNNLNIFYKEDSSNFKRNIDQLNLKFYLETEKIISLNQNKENIVFNSNKLFLILFKQINLYIKEIERLNSLMINSSKDEDKMKKRMSILIKKQNDFETKEQIIKTLKYSIYSLEKKLSDVLISENKLRQEIHKLEKEKNFYYNYYKSCISSMNNDANNKSQKIKDLKQNNNKSKDNNFKQNSKNNSKNLCFRNSKDIIILNDNNSSINEHKRNNSENNNDVKDKNKMTEIQKYYNGSPKKIKKKNYNPERNTNNIKGSKSIIRLCNYNTHSIEIDVPLGFKSKSPDKINSPKPKDIHSVKGRKTYNFQKSTIINENKLDLNIINNNSNTFIFDNLILNKNKTIYNTINQNNDLSINKLFKNKTNIEKNNYEEDKSKFGKKRSQVLKKVKNNKELDIDMINLNELENLLIEIKDYLINNEKKNNIIKSNNITKSKNIINNQNNSNLGKKVIK